MKDFNSRRLRRPQVRRRQHRDTPGNEGASPGSSEAQENGSGRKMPQLHLADYIRSTISDVLMRVGIVSIIAIAWHSFTAFFILQDIECEFDIFRLFPIVHPVATLTAVILFDCLDTAGTGLHVASQYRGGSLYKHYCVLLVVEFAFRCRRIVRFLAAEFISVVAFVEHSVDMNVLMASRVLRLVQQVFRMVGTALRLLFDLLKGILRVIGYIVLPIWYPCYCCLRRRSTRQPKQQIPLRQTPAIEATGNVQERQDQMGNTVVQYNFYMVQNDRQDPMELVDALRLAIGRGDLQNLQQLGLHGNSGRLPIDAPNGE